MGFRDVVADFAEAVCPYLVTGRDPDSEMNVHSSCWSEDGAQKEAKELTDDGWENVEVHDMWVGN